MDYIDFEGPFRCFLQQWLAGEGQDFEEEEWEEALPEVYALFLDTPAPWLEGSRPREYFAACADPQSLVEWMEGYICQGMEPPQLLLERILSLRDSAPFLCAILDRDQAPRQAKMLAVTLLREMGSVLPMHRYVAWQRVRELQDELCDNAVESLELIGEAAVKPMVSALEGATDAGKEALLSLLSRFPGEEKVFEALLALFNACPSRQVTLATYLGRLGDLRAIPALRRRAMSESVGYLDYIELRNAIERLGGDVPQRVFYGDDEYDAVFGNGD